MDSGSPAETQLPGGDATPSPTAPPPPLGDVRSSVAPTQTRRATLIAAGGVAAGTCIKNDREKRGKRENISFHLTIISRPSASSLKKKKPSLPHPAPPTPLSPSRTRTSPPSANATLSPPCAAAAGKITEERRRPSRPSSSSCRSASSRRAAPSPRSGPPTFGRPSARGARWRSRLARRSLTSSKSCPLRKRAGKKRRARGRSRGGRGRQRASAGTGAPRLPMPSASPISG